MGRYYIKEMDKVKMDFIPQDKFIGKLLEDSGFKRKYFDHDLRTEVFVCENAPRNSAIFGVYWQKIQGNGKKRQRNKSYSSHS